MLQQLRDYLTWQRVVIAWAVFTAIATFVNARLPKDADGKPMRPKSWGQFVWMSIVDLAALSAQPGKMGLFGRANLPGMPSHEMADSNEIGGGK